jgi:D-alanyl-D-alanine carboxypeptidase/D-alanyl-D-alanine-endopeptidase (penicillin-binding protein 4)
MNPASVMKLVTTFAALDLLGPAYTWSDTVFT